MTKKEQDIQNARKTVGWVYDDLRWVTESEAAKAEREREKLLGFLHDKVSCSFSGTKLHTGPLSHGCQLCGEGYWSCLFINHQCTANCFFCPQNRKMTEGKSPITAHGLVFEGPEEYADFLAYSGYKGVAFSGGESMLAFDEMKTYISELRGRFHNDLFIWIYTNGDLTEKEKLAELSECGLNEIRFNISARGYGLENVERAMGIIDTVTIEIPAIPDDYEIVRRSLKRMQKMGISNLNLHQLLATQYNYRNFVARDYTFLHQPSITILESELTALRLMRYAVENNISLPINYCSSFYKSEFQPKGNRMRISSRAMEDYEELTETGHIRRMEIRKGSDEKSGTVIRSHALRTLDLAACDLLVSYFEPSLKIELTSAEANRVPSRPMQDKMLVDKTLLCQLELAGEAEINGFLQLVFEKKDEAQVRRSLLQNCRVNTRADLSRLMETVDKIISIRKLEYVGDGFPEIY